MAIATASSGARRSVLRHAPLLALALAVIAVALLTVGPIGWRAGWWHFRFAFQTLMPWAAYFGIAALGVSVLTLLLGRSRIESRGIAIAIIAFAAGGLVTYGAISASTQPASSAISPRCVPQPAARASLFRSPEGGRLGLASCQRPSMNRQGGG